MKSSVEQHSFYIQDLRKLLTEVCVAARFKLTTLTF